MTEAISSQELWHEINNPLTAVTLTLEWLQRNLELTSRVELEKELDFSLRSLAQVRNVIRLANGEERRNETFDLIELTNITIANLHLQWPQAEMETKSGAEEIFLTGNKTAMIQG